MSDSINLRQYINLGLKWWWLVLLMTTLAAATGYLYSRSQPPVYQASSTIIVGQSIQATDLTSADILTSERLGRTYAEIALQPVVLQAVAEQLSLPGSWQGLQGRVSLTPVRDTQLLRITVEAASPEEARVTADALADQLIRMSPTALENQANAESQRFVQQRLASLQAKIEAGQLRLESLQASLAGQLTTSQLQALQAEITELEQLIAGWEGNYTQLLIVVEGKKSPNYLAVIQPAQAGATPIRPNTRQDTMLAAAVGLLLALGLIFLLEYLDDTIKTRDELGPLLGLTPLGAISRIKGKDYPEKLVATNELFAPVGESFRLIRSNIQFAAVDRPIQSIMITSPTPNEGKSVTVANLGVVMAQAGLKTIIIDADLRRPVQHQIFQISLPGGLTDLLCSPDLGPPSFLRNTAVANLSLLTSGPLPPNPSELLGSQRMEQLLADLAGLADVILLDSPPALMVADPMVLSNRVDGVVLVVKAGATRLGAARQAVVNLQQAGAHLLGGVVNQVKHAHSGYYYYHGYYHHAPGSANGHHGDPEIAGPGRGASGRRRLSFLKK